MDNRELAADCYRQALRCDVYCYEAFDALVQHHMLSSWEGMFIFSQLSFKLYFCTTVGFLFPEMVLLDSIPYSDQCSTPAEATFVRQLYEIKLNKYQGPHPDDSHPAKVIAVPSTPGLVLKGKLSLDITEDPIESQKPASAPLYGETQSNCVVKLLASNLDVLVSKAERLFYNCKFQSCLKLTEE